MKRKSLGQIAYEAHGENLIVDWVDLYDEGRQQWDKIANAVAREVRKRDKMKGKKK